MGDTRAACSVEMDHRVISFDLFDLLDVSHMVSPRRYVTDFLPSYLGWNQSMVDPQHHDDGSPKLLE